MANIFLTIGDFIGRFHPVLVHLPIGFLLLAALFFYLSKREKYQSLSFAVYYSLLFGAIAAALSCVTGFILSQNGEYDDGLVNKHQWLGIGLTIVSFVCLFAVKNKKPFAKYLMFIMGLLIVITGHYGGTLTHGEGYLTNSSSASNKNEKITFKPLPDVQQAIAYNDIVQPILQARCYSCHGSNKQKGKLRLDEPDFITKGGKDGKVIEAGNISESELVQRLLLPAGDEDRMPPKGKPQLTTEQIELLSWWVAGGADFHKKVSEIKQENKVKPVLASLQNGAPSQTANVGDVPEKEVEKGNEEAIKKLKELDVSISPVSQNSNYIEVSFITTDTVTSAQLQLLKKLSRQIIWLKLTGCKINDSVIAVVGNLTNLTKLSLQKSTIADNNLKYVNNLSQLNYLNLSNTDISTVGLQNLSSLKKLKQLYLFNTKISSAEVNALKQKFPNAAIDTGGYRLEFLASDTMKVKALKNK